MKVKDLIDLLGKVDPDTEVMCCGEHMDLYSNINILDKTKSIGEIWMIGCDEKVMLVQEVYGFGNYGEKDE
jgi:hypothetical protein